MRDRETGTDAQGVRDREKGKERQGQKERGRNRKKERYTDSETQVQSNRDIQTINGQGQETGKRQRERKETNL